MTPNLERELTEASRLAREAGRIVLELYDTDVEVQLKGRSDPVTEADKRANEYLVGELRRLFPDDGVVAEETADVSDAQRRGRCWYVDPLDGTKEFIAHNGEFSVMLGLAVDAEARLGVVYQPAKDKLYCGVVGQGATLETPDGTRPLRVSDTADPSQLRLVVSRSHRPKGTETLVARLGITSEMVSGSVGLKIGLIAEQEAGLYVHISSKSSFWDSCGPEAVLRAAGGRLTDLAGRLYRYEGTDMTNRWGLLACNAAAYDKVQPVAEQVAREVGLL